MNKNSGRKSSATKKITPKKDIINPFVTEFQQTCKTMNYTDQEMINKISSMIQQYDNQLRFVNYVLNAPLCKLLLKFLQKHTKLQQLTFYSCVIQDETFIQTLSNEFPKNTANCLSMDFMPVTREQILPLLNTPTLDILSLRGIQTLTSYDYKTHEERPFPLTLNQFFNTLSTSSIKVLNLYDCHIGDVGAIAMANTLMFNTNLQCLSLARNRIGDKGAIALSKSLTNYVLSEQESVIVGMFISEENKSKITDDGGNLAKKRKGQKPPPKKPPPKAVTKKGGSQRLQALINFDPNASISPVVSEKWKLVENSPDNQKIIPGNKTLNTLLLDENEIKKDGIAALKMMLSMNKYIINFSITKNLDVEEELLQSLTRKNE
ncbi:hypothetical protein TRFO_37871 [Tritrichomonas foetus]|uniref:Leucine Rich Repeat family protein n=1 Tax=Tritrichomonas foetus TaxID=1144522 RepID=A0A1J4JCI7_9EUKA|nr:hypothetical protein TRFO_37871 [Tritrichomonas foetus]|eukprot:OHS95975.1 hypothetical protein TRFO_37871 [Tritrichomonas foetus]